MHFLLRSITGALVVATAISAGAVSWNREAHAQQLPHQQFMSQANDDAASDAGFPEAFELIQQGMQYIGSGELQPAVDALNDALTISRDIGDRQLESIALIARGKALFDLGEADSAHTSLQDGLAIAQELGDAELEALAESVLAELE